MKGDEVRVETFSSSSESGLGPMTLTMFCTIGRGNSRPFPILFDYKRKFLEKPRAYTIYFSIMSNLRHKHTIIWKLHTNHNSLSHE